MGYMQLHNLAHTCLHAGLFVQAFVATPTSLYIHMLVAQFAMCSDIFNALLGITKANPITTMVQITSRLVVVGFGSPTHFKWLSMVWAISDATRYAYHLSLNTTLETFRYSQYKILYPISVSFELLSLIPAFDSLMLKMIILSMYATFFPKMFNHTSKLETHRTVKATLAKHKCENPSDFRIKYKDVVYHFTFENVAKVRTFLSGTRFNWKETGEENEYALRDFGIQVSWRLVYLTEYAGALVAYPCIVYQTVGGSDAFSRVDVWLWIIHYGKRLYESAFVHTFAADTMPFANIFKNSLYYWGAGVVLGALAPPTFNTNGYAMVFAWLACQGGNLYTHRYLANLRRGKDPKERVLPTHWLFQRVVSPNYGFEILGWICFALLDARWNWYTLARFVFALMGAGQMYVWAGGKRKRYKKLFGEKYRVHWRVLPFI